MTNVVPLRPHTVHVPRPTQPLDQLVGSWVAEGIISEDQARQIRQRDERLLAPAQPLTPGNRSGLVVEALGYLGGVLVLVAGAMLADRYWTELSTGARLGTVGAGVLMLLLAGLAVPARLGDLGSRLRSVLWFCATAATAGFVALFCSDVLELADDDIAFPTSIIAAVVGLALWVAHRTVLQQIAMMVAFMAVAAAGIAQYATVDSLPGLGIWAVALTWASLGISRLLTPERVAIALGAVGLLVGSLPTMSEDWGIVLALGTVALIVVGAVWLRDLILLGIGAVGALQALPRAFDAWFPGQVSAAVAMLAVGAGLVLAAVWIARDREPGPSGPPAGAVGPCR